MQVKAEDATDIPLEEYFKNHSGLGAYARVSIMDIGVLDEDPDSDDSEPCSPDLGIAAQLGVVLNLVLTVNSYIKVRLALQADKTL
jgi:hypothetical protein